MFNSSWCISTNMTRKEMRLAIKSTGNISHFVWYICIDMTQNGMRLAMKYIKNLRSIMKISQALCWIGLLINELRYNMQTCLESSSWTCSSLFWLNTVSSFLLSWLIYSMILRYKWLSAKNCPKVIVIKILIPSIKQYSTQK
jgi:hypothetical protein